MDQITDNLKIYELSRIWKEAAYNFAFWDKVDIDWDAEYRKALERVLATGSTYDYYRELKRFITLLGDGHSDVTFPNEIYQDAEYYSMLPVLLGKNRERVIVLNTSEGLKDSIPLYSTLLRIDGTDTQEYIRENLYPYFWHANEAACGLFVLQALLYGRRGSSAVYTFEKDGREFDVRLEREDPAKIAWRDLDLNLTTGDTMRQVNSSDTHTVRVTDDGIAVIRMMSFMDDSMPEKIYACFDELKKAKGYILDVRANTGGNSGNGNRVAALFIDGNFRSCCGETQVYEPTYKAWAVFREDFRDLSPEEAQAKFADDEWSLKLYRMQRNIFYTRTESDEVTNNAPGKLDGPVVVLMNEGTVSAGEDFVDVMKTYTDAVFIGNSTAGTSGQPLNVKLESGGAFRICTRRCIAQNGEDIYNKGFSPDIRLIPTVEDFAARQDAVLKKGLEVIRQKISG